MARVKKELISILETLSLGEMESLRNKLTGPRLKELRQKKAKLEAQLKEVDRSIALLEGKKTGRGRSKRAVAKRGKPVGRKAVKKSGPKNTMAEKIESILRVSNKPMRVKDIRDALLRAGQPKKAGLVNYINRILSITPIFVKAGWGLYTVRGKADAVPKKKAAKKAAKKAGKKAARKTAKSVTKKKVAIKKKREPKEATSTAA